MRHHPAVHTVFVSDHRVGVIASPAGRLQTEIAGYEEAWRALPRSVSHIVVIRDTPMNASWTRRCVLDSMARRARAGVVCALPRSVALQVDPAVVAARDLHSPRVRVIDMTRFMCGPRYCYPVVGGALVYRNLGHLATTFSATMAPYLGYAIRRALR